MQILALAREEFFHERHPQTLRDAALDLAFDQCWIDGAPDIVRRSHFEHAHCAKFDINFDLRHVRAEPEHRIWCSLPVLIQWRDRGIESGLASDDISVSVKGQLCQTKGGLLAVVGHFYESIGEAKHGAVARACQL